MKKILIHLLSFLTASLLFASETPSDRIPHLKGTDLNGKTWEAPFDFPKNRFLILVNLKRAHQPRIDSWMEGLELKKINREIPWIEMQVLDEPGKWFINRKMKHDIPDPAVRGRIWTVWTNYFDKKRFMRACGLSSSRMVYILIVNQDGRIIAMESGDYSMAAAERLFRALQI